MNGVADNTPQFGTTPPGEWSDDNTLLEFQNMKGFGSIVYDRDAPTVGETQVATNRCEGHTNFRSYLTFNDVPCSDYAPWYFKALWVRNATPEIVWKELNTGNIALPNAPTP